MSIDRTAYNALVDDDGTNTLGTPWNKTAVKNVLLDPMDAAYIGRTSIVNFSDTGTVNDFAPGIPAGQPTYLEWHGTADLTITGIAGGVNGQTILIKHLGIPGTVMWFPEQHTGSIPGNRLYNTLKQGPGTPVASMGWIQYMWRSGIWIMTGHEQGAWIDLPYSAAEFSSTGGSWSVPNLSVGTNRVLLHGRTLSVDCYLTNTTIAGSPTRLQRAVPWGLAAAVGSGSLAGGYQFGSVFDGSGTTFPVGIMPNGGWLYLDRGFATTAYTNGAAHVAFVVAVPLALA